MTTTGFILITTTPTKEKSVYDILATMDEVVERYGLFGEYDIIAKISAEDTKTLTKVVIDKIREIDGIIDTKTLIGAEL